MIKTLNRHQAFLLGLAVAALVVMTERINFLAGCSSTEGIIENVFRHSSRRGGESISLTVVVNYQAEGQNVTFHGQGAFEGPGEKVTVLYFPDELLEARIYSLFGFWLPPFIPSVIFSIVWLSFVYTLLPKYRVLRIRFTRFLGPIYVKRIDLRDSEWREVTVEQPRTNSYHRILILNGRQLLWGGYALFCLVVMTERLSFLQGTEVVMGGISRVYQDQGREMWEIQFTLDSTRHTFKTSPYYGPERWTQLPVIYHTDEPSSARVFTFFGFWLPPIWLTIMLIFGWLLIAYFMLSPKSTVGICFNQRFLPIRLVLSPEKVKK